MGLGEHQSCTNFNDEEDDDDRKDMKLDLPMITKSVEQIDTLTNHTIDLPNLRS